MLETCTSVNELKIALHTLLMKHCLMALQVTKLRRGGQEVTATRKSKLRYVTQMLCTMFYPSTQTWLLKILRTK